MAITITPYNHTIRRFLEGSNAVGDSYGVNLYSALTFDPTHTTKTQVDGAATQLPTADGYVQNGTFLQMVSVATVSTTGARFTAEPVVWNASGGDLSATFALIYNDDDADKAPVAVVDFDGTLTAVNGTSFRLNWNSDGILRVVVV